MLVLPGIKGHSMHSLSLLIFCVNSHFHSSLFHILSWFFSAIGHLYVQFAIPPPNLHTFFCVWFMFYEGTFFLSLNLIIFCMFCYRVSFDCFHIKQHFANIFLSVFLSFIASHGCSVGRCITNIFSYKLGIRITNIYTHLN